MASTDIRVHDIDVRFREVPLSTPLTISGGSITHFTIAEVSATVVSQSGRRAVGYGESVLSVLWAWPRSAMSVEERDGVMRDLVHRAARTATALEPADPITLWRSISRDALESASHSLLSEQVPKLAVLLAVGAVDNALHDAWGKAADQNVFEMYNAAHLREDLSVFGMPGVYPEAGIQSPRRSVLPVQHLVGMSDPLTSAGGARGLDAWIERDGVSRLKVKIGGTHPADDARRISDVYRAALAMGRTPRLAVDPNEGYADSLAAITMLDELAGLDAEAAAAIDYLEQPVPRDQSVDANSLRQLSERVPTIMDEGFTTLSRLPGLRQEGWSGVVIKAGKGQTPAVVAAAVARKLGLFVTVQDLTATGAAFVHSARLASSLKVSVDQLEYNSRQYAPTGNDELSMNLPDLTIVRDGQVDASALSGPGLYGLPEIGSGLTAFDGPSVTKLGE